MVSCNYVGRLGNQMFQEAATIGYALKHNMPYEFNLQGLPIYKEPCFEYREIPYMENLCLSGYFQSEKYFSHCKEEIIKHFTKDWNREQINKISIHVRRGDYCNIECHPVVTLEYIKKAVKYFKDLGYNDFIVFTDDKQWCSENLPFEISNGNEREDLELMSRCEHNIISNSSFSWWGAWLNPTPNKIVIAPDKWFAGSKENVNVSDLYCKGWVVL